MKTGRAERQFAKALREIARHVGRIIEPFPPGDPTAVPTIERLLNAYAEILKPWAERTVERMHADVNARDLDAWRRLGSSISLELHRHIRSASIAPVFAELKATQVALIQSLSTEAAERVHELTVQGLEDSTRALEIKAEILRSGEVTESRALLIARTEVSRTATTLTQARAQQAGSTHYIWQTSRDATVRPSHKAMQGKLVPWDEPPVLDGLVGHAGALPNCRCYPEPVIGNEEIAA